MVIVCGWCGKETANKDRCTSCGHVDPPRPWVQRGEPVPTIAAHAGRPAVDPTEARRRLSALGGHATDEQLADHHQVDERTVRRWRKKVSG